MYTHNVFRLLVGELKSKLYQMESNDIRLLVLSGKTKRSSRDLGSMKTKQYLISSILLSANIEDLLFLLAGAF